MTSLDFAPLAAVAPRRPMSRWPRALTASMVFHVGLVAWAAQLGWAPVRWWSVAAGINSTAAIEAQFSEGDLNAQQVRDHSEEIAIQIPKSIERLSPEERLATGGGALAVAKRENEPPQPPAADALQGELPAPSIEVLPMRPSATAAATVEAVHATGAVPRARRDPMVQVEPIEPSVASAGSPPAADSRGASIATPTPVSNPAPDYPAEALVRGLAGRVLIRVKIDGQGRVVGASVYRSSGVPLLDEAALAAVRSWRYEAPGPYQPREFAEPVNFVIGQP